MSKYVLEEHNGEGRIVGIPVSQKSELGLLIGDTKEQLECGLPMNGKVYRCSDIKEMEAKIEELQQANDEAQSLIGLLEAEVRRSKQEVIDSVNELYGMMASTMKPMSMSECLDQIEQELNK